MAARPPIPASQAGLMVLVFTLCVLAGAALVFLMPGGYQARAVLPPLPPSVIARLTAEPLLARVAARVGPGRLAPAVAAALGKDLRVRPESGRVVLRYTHDDPEVARAVLTALLQVAEDRHALLVGPAQVRLLEARDQAAARFLAACVGRTVRVVGERGGLGRSEQYAPVRATEPVGVGELATVRLTGVRDDVLIGELA